MSRSLIAIFFIFSLFQAKSQTCSIVSSDIACKEQLMGFDVTASAGISSVAWDMGDGNTSSQKNFNHKYATIGVKNVKVTLTLTGGGTCVATKKITVYQLPKFNISFKKDNNYCLWNNNICIIDSSIGGDSAVKIKKRIVIWDDGSQSIIDNPKRGDMACHNYINSGTFKVRIEIINDKDCKSDTVIDIVVLKDVVPDVSVYCIDNNALKFCDSARAEFYDATTSDTSTVISKIYDWGDGSPKITTKSAHLQHFYHKSGQYKVSLTYIQKNGCATTREEILNVIVYEIKFNITKNAYKQCLGQTFRFTQKDPIIYGFYRWFMNDTLLNPLFILEDQLHRKSIDMNPDLGKKLISLEIYNQGCVKIHKYDTIEVIGVKPTFVALNHDQCLGIDTVYFKVTVKTHGMGKLNYFWDLGDDSAQQCTTSWVKGGKSNCNFATDSLAKHVYKNKICRTWKLFIKDPLFGCDEERNGVINTIKPKTVNFRFSGDRFCIGDKPDYYVYFDHNICPIVKAQINIDSACDKDRWSTRFINVQPYRKTCNKDGWITVGLAITYGSPIVYTGYNDKKDFYIDSGRVCYDTIWKHNWFRLYNDPVGSFDPKVKCIKEVTHVLIPDSVQKDIAYAAWIWGDGTKIDTFIMPKGDSIIKPRSHIYKKAGVYVMTYGLETIHRCYSSSYKKIIEGFRMDFTYDSVICPGSSVLFEDKMFYMDSSILGGYLIESKNFWKIPKRKQQGREIFKWDFDDGRGFVTDTSNPVVKFPKKGYYKVRLAAKDSLDCWDTLTKIVHVGGLSAGIKKITGKILCDGVVQLYDSSFSDYKPPTDSIIYHHWEFGDNGNPSYLPDPIHHYNDFGEYTIFKEVENTIGCRDTTYIKIKVEGPEAKFEIVDTVGCAPFTAEFKNTSIRTSDYIWFFGDSAKSRLSTNRDTNVRFTYTKPGVYYIYLYGSDSVVNSNNSGIVYYCKTFFPDTTLANHPVRKIIVLEVPKADFTVDPVQCTNKSIVVTDKSDSLYKTYKWTIPKIDSITTSNKTGILLSKDSGVFVIKYTPSYPPLAPYNKSCLDTVFKTVRISEITSEFDVFKDTSSCPVFTFTNTTKGYKSVKWDLGDSASGNAVITDQNEVVHTYKSKTGTFYPCLFTENIYGCADTLCKEVEVDVVNKLKIPNVFTPGTDDKLNDVFEIVASGMDEYDLTIYNRWGQQIFHSTNKENHWTGRRNGNGSLYPDGSYFYMFKYKFNCEAEKQETHGIITLIGGKD